MIPEDIIDNFKLTDQVLKDYLINHFNRLSLQHYKEHQTLLSSDKVTTALPSLMANFYKSNDVVVAKKTGSFWAEDEDNINTLTSFIKERYIVSTTPDTKFKDLMTAFAASSGLTIVCIWSNKYEKLCQKINLKFEKVVNPKFSSKGGTCHVYLKSKVKGKMDPTLLQTGTIPDLF